MTSRVFSDYFTSWHADMAMSKTAVAAVRAGYAVVPVRPGGKIPLCTLTALQRSRDKGHACGVAHVIVDAAVAKRVFDRLAVELGMEANIGIVAAPSRLVVVDADTPEAVSSFLTQWADSTDDSRYLVHSPTVSTPGSLVDGEWRHKDGGHWYFDVPEGIVLPEYPTQMRGGGGYEVRWGNQMTVAPPSRRAEGPYIVNGDALEIPAWLLVIVQDQGRRRTERLTDLLDRFVNDGIVAWSLIQEWGQLLLEDHWEDTSKLDTCGCPIFEKPGGGTSSRKSATAHDSHCSAPIYQNIEGHGALHLWTDDPPEPLASWMTRTGKRTITLFEYVTLTRYDNDEMAAKIGLGIIDNPAEWWAEKEVLAQPRESSPEVETPWSEPRGREVDPGTSPPTSGTSRTDDQAWEDEAHRALRRIGLDTPTRVEAMIPRAQDRAFEMLVGEVARSVISRSAAGSLWPTDEEVYAGWIGSVDTTVPTHLLRTDGQPLLCAGATNLAVARRGTGKTWMGMDACLEVVDAGGRAAYLDLDDPTGSMRGRYETMGRDIDALVKRGCFRRLNQQQIPTSLSVSMLDDYVGHLSAYEIVVFDVINHFIRRMGGDPNTGNQEVADLFDHLWNPLAAAGVLVLLLSHPNRAGQERGVDPAWVDPAGPAGIMNTISGTGLSMGVIRPFTKLDPLGSISLFCRKARGGLAAEGDPLGTFRATPGIGVDTGAWCIDFTITPPDDKSDEERAEEGIANAADRIVDILETREPPVAPMNRSDIKRLMSKNQVHYFDDAIVRVLHQRRAIEVGRRIDLPPEVPSP